MKSNGRSSVLIVDDDPAMLMLVARLVENIGFEAVTAPDANTALRVLLEGRTQMLLTDWQMPRMDGLELTSGIRELDALPFTYIILMTGVAPTDEAVGQAFAAGIDDFIAKPIRRCELLSRLHAGQRMIHLQAEVERKQREVQRFGAEMQIANARLASAQEKLRILASTDELTGLGNRREARAQLQSYWRIATRHGNPLSCIMLDIDHFKRINDTYGHDVGDQVLAMTAQVLAKTVRETDPAFRIGGEEFVVVCPEADEAAAARAAERYREAVQALRINTGRGTLQLTISLGVAQRAEGMTDIDDLLKAADDALYHAKHTGRNRAMCHSALPADCEADTTQQPAAAAS